MTLFVQSLSNTSPAVVLRQQRPILLPRLLQLLQALLIQLLHLLQALLQLLHLLQALLQLIHLLQVLLQLTQLLQALLQLAQLLQARLTQLPSPRLLPTRTMRSQKKNSAQVRMNPWIWRLNHSQLATTLLVASALAKSAPPTR